MNTVQSVKEKLAKTTTEHDWNKACEEIKAANRGRYPDFWLAEIVLSGFMAKVISKF